MSNTDFACYLCCSTCASLRKVSEFQKSHFSQIKENVILRRTRSCMDITFRPIQSMSLLCTSCRQAFYKASPKLITTQKKYRKRESNRTDLSPVLSSALQNITNTQTSLIENMSTKQGNVTIEQKSMTNIPNAMI